MANPKNKSRGKSKPVRRIPTLTDAVTIGHPTDTNEEPESSQESSDAWPDEQALAELRSTLTTQTIDLASQLLHGAVREMEAALLEQVLDRLRQQLPILIDDVLNEQLSVTEEQPDDNS